MTNTTMKWRDLTLTTTQTIGNRQKYNKYKNDKNDMKQ